ncbi:MAG TPA: STAS domain-containing protein [Verrucomicrobiae bacterium]|jgi:rsbT co-antagonist protein RsbR|nr:STAS domain-containing protein [Verrucomicrobiae bacterium]
MTPGARITELIKKREAEILQDWLQRQLGAMTIRTDLMKKSELEEQARTFLSGLTTALQRSEVGDVGDIRGPAWGPVREQLAAMSQSRARQGFTPSETATFVFSLKEPLFAHLQKELAGDAPALATELWTTTVLLDKLGLFTVEAFLKSHEDTILSQQRTMLELSTPVVELWKGILALPLIGTLDSERTQLVMESLLTRIVETGASIAIIDITGVPTVDTLVAQHLLKTVAAARLMGAECLISGIRPQIAQTIVHLGVDLGDVTTKSTLAGAFGIALQRTGLSIGRATPRTS